MSAASDPKPGAILPRAPGMTARGAWLVAVLMTQLPGCATTREGSGAGRTAPSSPAAGAVIPDPFSDERWTPPDRPGSHPIIRAQDPVTPARRRDDAGGNPPRAPIAGRLPAGIRDPEGWARDLAEVFQALGLAPTERAVCAVVAVIEQESSFQADPPVAGLSTIVRREIDRRRQRYHIPEAVVRLALSVQSPDGRSYDQRIDALRTENDLNRLYADMIAELPLGRQLLADYNPVRTGGPMQVSLAFAEARVRQVPYPFPMRASLRDEVFSRRGGVYFGTAYLLGYPAPYRDTLYRFADYNAGRYASRNAAFQYAVGRLSGIDLACDGDLLRYRDGAVDDEPSQTLAAVLTLAARLGLTREAILGDLQQEKSAGFESTALFRRVFALARESGLEPVQARLPDIRLDSPKISGGLTTATFARRVHRRYQNCLGRR